MQSTDKPSVWDKYWKYARLLIVDAMLFLTVLAILAIGFFALKLLEINGYPHEYVERLEQFHFIAYGTVLFIFVVDLVLKVLIAVVGDHS